MRGKYCMVRTRSAGVFAGTLTALEGQTATLTNARRIWYWDGAASLSQLANDGPSKPQNCNSIASRRGHAVRGDRNHPDHQCRARCNCGSAGMEGVISDCYGSGDGYGYGDGSGHGSGHGDGYGYGYGSGYGRPRRRLRLWRRLWPRLRPRRRIRLRLLALAMATGSGYGDPATALATATAAMALATDNQSTFGRWKRDHGCRTAGWQGWSRDP